MIREVKRKNKRRKNLLDFEKIEPVISKGMQGGNYKPLSDIDIKKIHSTALDVLENLEKLCFHNYIDESDKNCWIFSKLNKLKHLDLSIYFPFQTGFLFSANAFAPSI